MWQWIWNLWQAQFDNFTFKGTLLCLFLQHNIAFSSTKTASHEFYFEKPTMQFENAVQSLGENVHYKACPFKANVLLLVCGTPSVFPVLWLSHFYNCWSVMKHQLMSRVCAGVICDLTIARNSWWNPTEPYEAAEEMTVFFENKRAAALMFGTLGDLCKHFIYLK